MKKPVIAGNTIEIPSSQDFLPDVDSFIEKILKKLGIDKSTIADIAISVTEMVINSIVHGNQSNNEKSVKISLSGDKEEVEIQIADEGGGFDPGAVENPIDEKNLLKEVGRGIFITKSLMDSVNFETNPDGGTVVILKKKIVK